MTEIESFSAKHTNNNCSGITIYFCDGIPSTTKEMARDLVRRSKFRVISFEAKFDFLFSGLFPSKVTGWLSKHPHAQCNKEIGEDVSSEDSKSSVNELIR